MVYLYKGKMISHGKRMRWETVEESEGCKTERLVEARATDRHPDGMADRLLEDREARKPEGRKTKGWLGEEGRNLADEINRATRVLDESLARTVVAQQQLAHLLAAPNRGKELAEVCDEMAAARERLEKETARLEKASEKTAQQAKEKDLQIRAIHRALEAVHMMITSLSLK